MFSKTTLSSKFAAAALLLLLVFVGQLKYRQWLAMKAIQKEKNSLTEQERQLTQRNKELANSLAFLQSADFKEKVARQQLNLQREGEVVYSFSNNSIGDNSAQNSGAPEQSNLKKWWNYFFTKGVN